MELLANAVFWTAVLANLTAQTLKLLLYYFLEGRFQWHRFLDTGGMPSTHSATVSALAVSVGLREGFDTSLFAVAAVFALIVMYDAAGIRRAAGLHAQLLNQLMEELGQVIRLGPQRGPLKELLGHTYLEVAVGALIGGLVALSRGVKGQGLAHEEGDTAEYGGKEEGEEAHEEGRHQGQEGPAEAMEHPEVQKPEEGHEEKGRRLHGRPLYALAKPGVWGKLLPSIRRWSPC